MKLPRDEFLPDTPGIHDFAASLDQIDAGLEAIFTGVVLLCLGVFIVLLLKLVANGMRPLTRRWDVRR